MESGSSPRVRGTLFRRLSPVSQTRFIPACAGNACASSSRISRSTVHPRVCGERSVNVIVGYKGFGSSPRVRGTRRAALLVRHASTVHPRVCGERLSGADSGNRLLGSSPRVRGTPPRRIQGCPRDRFIPACAGNARRIASSRPGHPVHPRVCEERHGINIGQRPLIGSSPRVRGTLVGGIARRQVERFIPACAGNAKTSKPAISALTVHPRVCGERVDEENA